MRFEIGNSSQSRNSGDRTSIMWTLISDGEATESIGVIADIRRESEFTHELLALKLRLSWSELFESRFWISMEREHMPEKFQSCEYLRITLQVRANTPSPPQLFSGSVSFAFLTFVKMIFLKKTLCSIFCSNRSWIESDLYSSAKEEIKQPQSQGFKVNKWES